MERSAGNETRKGRFGAARKPGGGGGETNGASERKGAKALQGRVGLSSGWSAAGMPDATERHARTRLTERNAQLYRYSAFSPQAFASSGLVRNLSYDLVFALDSPTSDHLTCCGQVASGVPERYEGITTRVPLVMFANTAIVTRRVSATLTA
jgi:hypothetical protein